jgi:hypothetical protein
MPAFLTFPKVSTIKIRVTLPCKVSELLTSYLTLVAKKEEKLPYPPGYSGISSTEI